MSTTHAEYSELELNDPRVAAAIEETIVGQQEVLRKELEQLKILRAGRSGFGKLLNLLDPEVMNLVRHTTALERRIASLQKRLQQI